MSVIKGTILTCILFIATDSCIVDRNSCIAGSSPRTSVGNPDQICTLFEMYNGGTDVKGVKERLDGFALFLKLNPAFTGYIVSYAGRRACRDEALKRARLAKTQLTTKEKTGSRRISIIDGGYREKWEVELWYAPSAAKDRPAITETIDRRKVQIIKNCDP